MSDGEITAQDLTMRGQQYRNFDPGEVAAVIDNQGIEAGQRVLRFIESARFEPFLSATSKFFDRLDRDEQDTFTQRNPDVVQWMTVWNESEEFNPLDDLRSEASDLLTSDRSERTEPPVSFERRELTHETLLRDMAFRRRSYRNWTPGEFREIAQQDHSISRGMLDELELFDAEIRQEIDTPVEVDGKTVGRALFDRIEAGRFEPVASNAHTFFAPLDPDERRLFARRNPGMTEWLSIWGFLQDLIHGNQLFSLSDVSFPLVPEIKPGEPNTGFSEDEINDPSVDKPCHLMPDVIRGVLDRLGRDPCKINLGECQRFAETIQEHVPDADLIDNIEFASRTQGIGSHVFLRCDGRFYDSEAPDGVTDFRDLPFFERNFDDEQLIGAFIKDRKVAKEGVFVPGEPQDFADEVGVDLDDLNGIERGIFDKANKEREQSRDDDDNTVWLEVVITQGRPFTPGEEIEVAENIEDNTMTPARKVFCTSDDNVLTCFIMLDVDRVPSARIDFFERALERAEAEWIGRSFDQLNIVDEEEVREAIGPPTGDIGNQ